MQIIHLNYSYGISSIQHSNIKIRKELVNNKLLLRKHNVNKMMLGDRDE